jgi:hypothetical protein
MSLSPLRRRRPSSSNGARFFGNAVDATHIASARWHDLVFIVDLVHRMIR